MRRGFTLIEMIFGVAVFLFVATASFLFAQGQIRARKQTQMLLDTEQNARVSLDAVRADLQSAGYGVGYDPAGTFAGLPLGAFGPGFTTNNFTDGAGHVSDDLRVRGALGPARTVAAYDAPAAAGTLEVCGGAGFQNGERVLLLSESYVNARAITVTAVTPAVACAQADCVGAPGNCDRLAYADDSASFETDASAKDASYLGGTIIRNYFDVVYFVDWSSGEPGLFRADWPCASRAACAVPNNLLGEGVESLQLRLWEQPPAGAPVDATTNPAYLAANGVSSPNRLRLEVEVIARSRSEEAETPENRVCSSIAPALCFPLGGGQDKFRRRTLATSVELKNSGHMRFQALR